jgi:hypothetical protein
MCVVNGIGMIKSFEFYILVFSEWSLVNAEYSNFKSVV